MEIRDAQAVRLGDEVWIATALLHREHPERAEFTVSEIVARARSEAIGQRHRTGVYQHAQTHCVANRKPQPARLRMLFATGRTTRRLYRPGDPYHPGREGGRSVPDRGDLPSRYRELVDWYETHYMKATSEKAETDSLKARGAEGEPDPLMRLRGLGRELWKDEKADDYVRRLREGWS